MNAELRIRILKNFIFLLKMTLRWPSGSHCHGGRLELSESPSSEASNRDLGARPHEIKI